jgi:hypothetical protein
MNKNLSESLSNSKPKEKSATYSTLAIGKLEAKKRN